MFLAIANDIWHVEGKVTRMWTYSSFKLKAKLELEHKCATRVIDISFWIKPNRSSQYFVIGTDLCWNADIELWNNWPRVFIFIWTPTTQRYAITSSCNKNFLFWIFANYSLSNSQNFYDYGVNPFPRRKADVFTTVTLFPRPRSKFGRRSSVIIIIITEA